MKRNILVILISVLIIPLWAQSSTYRLLIGTYTNTGKSEGIYSYEVDMNKGVFTKKSLVTGISNPSYLAIAPDKSFVYSVNENATGSAANAFIFDKNNAKLTLINSSNTYGANPCYITVSNKHVFTANYTGGSISVFARNADGSLTNLQQLIQHRGSSINPKRQKEPHVHQVIFTPDNKYLVANDLGTDKVTVYKYNPTGVDDILVPHDSILVKAGSGPRHITFSKNGKRAYLLQEMDGTVSVFEMKSGKLKLLQENTVVKKTDVETGAADIHLSPDGKFLYATNRGTANDISCFSVKKNGTVQYVSQVSTGGKGPRNFSITPDGNYIFVANQYTDNVVVFKRNKKTGNLLDTGKQLEMGTPVCLVFY